MVSNQIIWAVIVISLLVISGIGGLYLGSINESDGRKEKPTGSNSVIDVDFFDSGKNPISIKQRIRSFVGNRINSLVTLPDGSRFEDVAFIRLNITIHNTGERPLLMDIVEVRPKIFADALGDVPLVSLDVGKKKVLWRSDFIDIRPLEGTTTDFFVNISGTYISAGTGTMKQRFAEGSLSLSVERDPILGFEVDISTLGTPEVGVMPTTIITTTTSTTVLLVSGEPCTLDSECTSGNCVKLKTLETTELCNKQTTSCSLSCKKCPTSGYQYCLYEWDSVCSTQNGQIQPDESIPSLICTTSGTCILKGINEVSIGSVCA